MITSLFQYAEFFHGKQLNMGSYLKHGAILDYAAKQLIKGYINLDEANEETLTRLDAYGNEISPEAVYDAVNYLREKR